MKESIEVFRRIDFLESLDDEAIARIISLFEEESYRKGTVLFNEDDIGDCFYVVKTGKVGITKRLKIAQHVTGELRYFGPYEYFGELALIDDEPRSANAIISEDSVLYKVCKIDFLTICREYPDILFTLVKTMSRRLRDTNERYISIWDELLMKNKLAAVGSAAGKIIHDIKNPITIIVLTAQLMEKVFEGSSEFTERIVGQVNKVKDMVKEILDFASGEQTGFDISRTDLQNFFKELEEDMQPVIEARNLEMFIDNRVTRKVKIDSDKMSRVFANLIKNAMEAFEGKPGKIFIQAEILDNNLRFQVVDTGPGFNLENLSTVFDPFVTYNKKSGTGLGLAICKKIVEVHNGNISASNSNEGGAKIEINIPLSG